MDWEGGGEERKRFPAEKESGRFIVYYRDGFKATIGFRATTFVGVVVVESLSQL